MRGQKRVMYLNLHPTVFQLLARRPGLAVRQVRQGGQETVAAAWPYVTLRPASREGSNSPTLQKFGANCKSTEYWHLFPSSLPPAQWFLQ